MADRRRRRHSENDSGEESSDVSFNTNTKVRLSECESETEHPEASELSEYESTADESRFQETEDSDGDYETEEELTAEEESDGEGKTRGQIDEERQSGDGEEQPDENLDDDEDKKNPAYIPRKGAFYEHDMRLDPDEELPVNTGGEIDEKRGKGRLWKDESRWLHDKFDMMEQAPKSRQELIAMYGYDIMMDDKPPEQPPRMNRRPRGGKRGSARIQDFLPTNLNTQGYNKGYDNNYPPVQDEYSTQTDRQTDRMRRGQGQRWGQGQRYGNYSDTKDNYSQDNRGFRGRGRREYDNSGSNRNYDRNEDNSYGNRNNYGQQSNDRYVQRNNYGNNDNYSNRDSNRDRNTYGNRENYSNYQDDYSNKGNYRNRDNNQNQDNSGDNYGRRDNYQDRRRNYGPVSPDSIDARGDNRRNYQESSSRGDNFRGGYRGDNNDRYNRKEFGSGRSDISRDNSKDSYYSRQNSGGFDRPRGGHADRESSHHQYERQDSDSKTRPGQRDFQKSQSPTRDTRKSNFTSSTYRSEIDRRPVSSYSKPSPKSYYTLSALDDERSVTDTQEYDELEHGQIQREDMRDFNVTVTEGGSRRSTTKDKGRPISNRGQDGGEERKDPSVQGKHQPQLPPRLQQQHKEQQERKRQQQLQQQQQQQQVQTVDTSQRSNKRYSSQRQRAAADSQESEIPQHVLPPSQSAAIPPQLSQGYPQNFSPPKPVNPQQSLVIRQSLNQAPPPALQKGQVIQAGVPGPQLVMARAPPHIVPVSPRPPTHSQGATLRQPPPQSISGSPVYTPGTSAVTVMGSPHLMGQPVVPVYAAPPPTYQIPLPQFPAPPPAVPAVPVRPAVTQPAPINQPGETVRGGTTYYTQSDVPVQGTGTTFYPPEMQVAKPNRVQIRRPKAAIPIVNPQDAKKGDGDSGDIDSSMSEQDDVYTDLPAGVDEEGEGETLAGGEYGSEHPGEQHGELVDRLADQDVSGEHVNTDTHNIGEHHTEDTSYTEQQTVISDSQSEHTDTQTNVNPPTSVVFKQEISSPTLSVSAVITPDRTEPVDGVRSDQTDTDEPTEQHGDETGDVKAEPLDESVDTFEDAVDTITQEDNK